MDQDNPPVFLAGENTKRIAFFILEVTSRSRVVVLLRFSFKGTV
jgi:hypothetical protein